MDILIVDDEPLARERIREMLKRETGVRSIREAANGKEAVRSISANLPDILFLDIQMPDMTGFDVLAAVDKKVVRDIPAIIFVTAYDEFALKAFEVHALDYLLKPFDRKRFADAFQRAKTQLAQHNDGQRQILDLLEQMNAPPEYLEWVTIKKDERILLLKVEDIFWIEAHGNYVRLKMRDSSQIMRETMDNLESRLDPKKFVRIHRSTIINVNQIKELQVWARGEYRVVTPAGKAFALSRGYRARFDEFLNKRSI